MTESENIRLLKKVFPNYDVYYDRGVLVIDGHVWWTVGYIRDQVLTELIEREKERE